MFHAYPVLKRRGVTEMSRLLLIARQSLSAAVPPRGVEVKTVPALVLLTLAGCVQTSNVIPTGKQSYVVSVVGNIGYNPTPHAIEKANLYCVSRGLVATVTALQHTEFPRITTQVQFLCTDSEHQQPSVLRPDNGVSARE